MLPKVYRLLHDVAAVRNIVGEKIYRHGSAPQNVVPPYITWSVISALPENELDDTPKIDNQTVQVNCWGDENSSKSIETLGIAVRDAIEAQHHIIDGPLDSRDPETMRYRLTFIFTFWNHRDPVSD